MTAPIVVVVASDESGDPVRLQSSVVTALEQACEVHRRRAELAAVIASLPTRTVDVLRESLEGQTTKAIAIRLDISERSVKRFRSRGLRALGVRTLPEAASMLARVGVEIPRKIAGREAA